MSKPPHVTVQNYVAKKGITAFELGKKAGLTSALVNETFSSPITCETSHWTVILDALGLELVVRLKPTGVPDPVEVED